MNLPQAQTESLITRWVDGELIVVDEATHAVHCLGDPAARVFVRCTGRQSVEQIAAAEGFSVEQVTELLGQLSDAGLLQAVPSKLDLTRRGFAGRVARAAALAGATPVVTSMLLPAAANAYSAVACSQAKCAGYAYAVASPQAARNQAHAQADASCRYSHLHVCGPAATCSGGSSANLSSPSESIYSGYYHGLCVSPGA